MLKNTFIMTIFGLFWAHSAVASLELQVDLDSVPSYMVEVRDLGLNMDSKLLLQNNTDNFDVTRTKILIAQANRSDLKLKRVAFSYLPAEDNQNGLPDELIKIPVGFAIDAVKKIVLYDQYGAYSIIAEIDLEDKKGNLEKCVSYGGLIKTSSKDTNLIHKIDLGTPSVDGSSNPVWGSSSPVCESFFKSIKISEDTKLVVR